MIVISPGFGFPFSSFETKPAWLYHFPSMLTPMVQFLSGCFMFFGPIIIGTLSFGSLHFSFLTRLMYIFSIFILLVISIFMIDYYLVDVHEYQQYLRLVCMLVNYF